MGLGIVQNMPETEKIPEFPEWQDQYIKMEDNLKDVPKFVPPEYEHEYKPESNSNTKKTQSKESIKKAKNVENAPLETNLERDKLDEDINLQKYPKPKGEKNPA